VTVRVRPPCDGECDACRALHRRSADRGLDDRPRTAAARAPAAHPKRADAWFRGGQPESDDCEKLLALAARARGGLDVAIAEGLHALRHRDRLAELGYHLDHYAREVLDVGRRAAESLAKLGGDLRTRPLLRDALRSGRVRIRAASGAVRVPSPPVRSRRLPARVRAGAG
jgi:hypothetical protein